jgi:hypothetical protein
MAREAERLEGCCNLTGGWMMGMAEGDGVGRKEMRNTIRFTSQQAKERLVLFCSLLTLFLTN